MTRLMFCPFDGMNKIYAGHSLKYHCQQFDALSLGQGGIAIDWERRYICQVARFDPFKGFDVLLSAYLRFRQMIGIPEALSSNQTIPQLIIIGHNLSNDSDVAAVYKSIRLQLSGEDYALVRDDVAVVRAPPVCDIIGTRADVCPTLFLVASCRGPGLQHSFRQGTDLK